MKLSDIDLNLFVVFDAIYTEGNLTRAGEIIGITQPAVSNSLARLRKALDDPLFVRTADGMVPTPVAQNLVGPVRHALGLIRDSVQQSDRFDPTKSDKKFRLSMSDLSQSIVFPGLLDRLAREAPNISIDCIQARRRDIPMDLTAGNLDLAVDRLLLPDQTLLQAPLFSYGYVCVFRKDHPIIREKLTLELFLQLGHISVSNRADGLGQVDLTLGRQGKRRRIRLRTQHYLSTPELICRTDNVLTVPQPFADMLVEQYPIRYLDLPFEVPSMEINLYWHESTDQAPANRWLRQIIQEVPKETGTRLRSSKNS